MKEPYGKGLAIHTNPESCAGGGNTAGEALTGAHAGRVFSSETKASAGRHAPLPYEYAEARAKTADPLMN
jgi:RNA-directed DNA polymerase